MQGDQIPGVPQQVQSSYWEDMEIQLSAEIPTPLTLWSGLLSFKEKLLGFPPSLKGISAAQTAWVFAWAIFLLHFKHWWTFCQVSPLYIYCLSCLMKFSEISGLRCIIHLILFSTFCSRSFSCTWWIHKEGWKGRSQGGRKTKCKPLYWHLWFRC